MGPFVRTDDNIADFFTKPMANAKKFYAMRARIMNEPPRGDSDSSVPDCVPRGGVRGGSAH